ncbi:putative carbonic anhydrase 3 isoform X2 [Diabrotica virgifera virgifera]|uniref:Carbonic anhydrase n=1 Tax=Diabrotica virgifera virgifera TaxID=50390 RepID=A0A6P7GNB8_DIAVI|nr:putative carbonic anhydrase 3 isoform X2 [Diabrotica virgifera virgifera]
MVLLKLFKLIYKLKLCSVYIGCIYDDLDAWPETCKTGQRQSPIDLNQKKAEAQTPDLFKFYSYNKRFRANIQNSGHGVVITFTPENKEAVSLAGSVLPETYIFDNLHFHWPSEHTINGKYYPLEAHFVHYARSAGSVAEGLKRPNGIAVLGVLLELSFDTNPAFESIIRALPNITESIKKPVELDKPISLAAFVPANKKSYFYYEGSLTTPDCNEAALWTVFTQRAKIGYKQYNILRHIYNNKKQLLIMNNRPLQQLNGRSVKYATCC